MIYFNDNGVCPKCRSEKPPSVKWHPTQHYIPSNFMCGGQNARDECLSVKCVVCGYIELQPPKDTKPPEEGCGVI